MKALKIVTLMWILPGLILGVLSWAGHRLQPRPFSR